MAVARMMELRRKRARRRKLALLRRRYNEAKSANEKARILDKVSRVAPGVELDSDR
jgi:hypothetical protein